MIWCAYAVAPPVFDRCHEFDVRDELHGRGISSIVPVQFVLRRRSPRRRPVYPGYVFAGIGSDEQHHLVMGTTHVLRLVGMLSPAEAAALEAASIPLTAQRRQQRLTVGAAVRYRLNAFATLDALVTRLGEGDAVGITFQLFGKSSTATVREEQLEPATM